MRRIRLLLRFVGMLIGMGARRVATAVKQLVRRAMGACRRLPRLSLSKIKRAFRLAWAAACGFCQALIAGIRTAAAGAKNGREAEQCEGKGEPVDPVDALIPVPVTEHGGEKRRAIPPPLRAILTSNGRLSHHRIMRYVQRGMIACGVGVVTCMLLLMALFVIRVREVRVQGTSYYDEAHILSCVEVQAGDELFSFSASSLERRLTEQLPYVRSASVKRKGRSVVITLEEYRPVWGLLLSDGRVALLDESRYVLEVCEMQSVLPGICLLYMSLPPIEGVDEQGEPVWHEQSLRAGDRIQGTSTSLELLDALTDALGQVELPAAPTVLDLTDPYAVTLTLEGGTVLYLRECKDAARRLQVAVDAVRAYRTSHGVGGEGEALAVYVDDFFRVTVRKTAKNGQ